MNISAHSNSANARQPHQVLLICLSAACLIFSGCKNRNRQDEFEIAVANSYLNAVIKDLCGNQQPVFDLVPPGMCPGHFDISPSQVNLLCNCKILFVFDFQQNIEKAIPRIKDRGLKVCKIAPSPGLCIPDSYLSVVRQVAETLSEEKPRQKSYYEQRLKLIEKRLEKLHAEIPTRIQEAGLENCNVLVSQHQKKFIEWLGLNPISTFAGQDTATPAQMNRNLRDTEKNPVKIVIANRQEGTEMAQALAGQLKAKLVIFSNFPNCNQQSPITTEYDHLVCENVNCLIEALKE